MLVDPVERNGEFQHSSTPDSRTRHDAHLFLPRPHFTFRAALTADTRRVRPVIESVFTGGDKGLVVGVVVADSKHDGDEK
jgi:hypothetical protein